MRAVHDKEHPILPYFPDVTLDGLGIHRLRRYLRAFHELVIRIAAFVRVSDKLF